MATLLPWRNHLTLIAESLIGFYLSTFCVAMFIYHRGNAWMMEGLIIGLLYVLVIVISAIRILKKFPIEAIMLITPLVPLIALIIVVTLIPLLQWF